MSKASISLMNRIMKPLLHSPLHFLASGWCMLITVKGRKTGRLYTTPVYYKQEGDCLRFFSGKTLKWVSNLRDTAPVTVRLRGKNLAGTAVCCPNSPTSAQLLGRMYPRMSPEKVAQLVLIEVRL